MGAQIRKTLKFGILNSNYNYMYSFNGEEEKLLQSQFYNLGGCAVKS